MDLKAARSTEGRYHGYFFVERTEESTDDQCHINSANGAEAGYLTQDGPVVIQETPLVMGAVDVPRFDLEALIAALRRDQAGSSSFPEFLAASGHAGVVRYEVDFKERAVTYYGCGSFQSARWIC